MTQNNWALQDDFEISNRQRLFLDFLQVSTLSYAMISSGFLLLVIVMLMGPSDARLDQIELKMPNVTTNQVWIILNAPI